MSGAMTGDGPRGTGGDEGGTDPGGGARGPGRPGEAHAGSAAMRLAALVARMPVATEAGLRARELALEVLEAARAAGDGAEGGWGATHRHVARGSECRVLGDGTLRSSSGRRFGEGDVLRAYVDAGGRMWHRAPEEFEDGRFAPIGAARGDGA